MEEADGRYKSDGEDMKISLTAPGWKTQMEDVKVEEEKMKKQFNSPDMKKQIKDMKTLRKETE